MSVIFQKAPLVELIVELRWDELPQLAPSAGAGPTIAFSPNSPVKDEELYMQFAALIAPKGFGRFERLVPPGFPVIKHQPICRYRPSAPQTTSPLYQLGSGMFSANALPPNYRSWKEFCPRVEEGLNILAEARKNTGQDLPRFTSAILRYVDAFDNELAGGLTHLEFISNVLGFKTEIPEAIRKVCVDQQKVFTSSRIELPTSLGIMSMTLGHGTVENKEAIIMDTSLVIRRDIGPSIGGAISVLTEGRAIIHEVFIGLTSSIHEAMKPEK